MTSRDVERIVRDVFTAKGIEATVLTVHGTAAGWRVMLRVQGDQSVGLTVPDGPPASVRAATERWADEL
jgi:hypothetical protein